MPITAKSTGGAEAPCRTAERIRALLDRLDREAAELNDQRGCPRRAVQGPVSVLPQVLEPGAPGDGGPASQWPPRLHAWAMDLSEAGIGLLIEQPLPAGSLWQVNLQSLAGQPLFLTVRVVYCQQLLPNAWRMGGVFIEMETEV